MGTIISSQITQKVTGNGWRLCDCPKLYRTVCVLVCHSKSLPDAHPLSAALRTSPSSFLVDVGLSCRWRSGPEHSASDKPWQVGLHLGVWQSVGPPRVSTSSMSWVCAPTKHLPPSLLVSHRGSFLLNPQSSISPFLPFSVKEAMCIAGVLCPGLSCLALPLDPCEPLQQAVCLQPLPSFWGILAPRWLLWAPCPMTDEVASSALGNILVLTSFLL